MNHSREDDSAADNGASIVTLMDALAGLAAELWAAGKLDELPFEDAEPNDADDE